MSNDNNNNDKNTLLTINTENAQIEPEKDINMNYIFNKTRVIARLNNSVGLIIATILIVIPTLFYWSVL
jgi:hypothetical protein